MKVIKMLEYPAIAGGKKRFTYYDFEKYFRKAVVAATPRPPSNLNRTTTRVFIIGPGFGNQLNPRQSRMVESAGYQIGWCFNIPNPELPNFPVEPYLDRLKSEMDAFRPHVIMGASKGGVYIVGLWRRGYWRGPTVLINAHPTCRQIPEEANVVVAVGSNDEVYPVQRPDLEALMHTGGQNKTFLYWTADSGRLPSGQISRQGDTHNQESLLHHDVLPRLIDATLCKEGPEMHFHRTWKERLSRERNNAELWLGYSPEQIMRLWSTNGHQSGKHLHDVPMGTEEYRMVNAAFKALPIEQQAYILSPPETWAPVRALRIQRVENGPQGDASWKPYYKSLLRSLEDQGVEFEPGTHTCWAFHGCNNEALESIVNNPVCGFQPLASGTRSTTLWGSGTYFARDAKYVADGGFCGAPNADGTRRMLMCLLIMGISCLGDPAHKGVLPFRHKPPHRYNSSVDCLASPEVMVIQQSGAAMPAYVITFA
ncbi:Poly [ADP-ribose] polymerase 10 [Symbiodinium microadriaticum]|uniref:Poly [ADP-ribose] polymerase 10 n=2 Tax=Symbiodinium TaxID=2949 RepID=A0A1Q9EV35_SYMMI|nr:Poly [ADP-ribose] polymerase 10 [Symbiodinium microadriaticum]